MSERFSPDTTSDVAGGVFRPGNGTPRGHDPALVQKWLKDAWDYYQGLREGLEGSPQEHGVIEVRLKGVACMRTAGEGGGGRWGTITQK